MNIQELRAEEDYCRDIGLELCDICERTKEKECERCRHHYPSLYAQDKVITTIREAKTNEKSNGKNKEK